MAWGPRKVGNWPRAHKRGDQKFEWAKSSAERNVLVSILSNTKDHFGFFYGYVDGDPRQINVREEMMVSGNTEVPAWIAYVGGIKVGVELSKGEAERTAIRWIKDNPQ